MELGRKLRAGGASAAERRRCKILIKTAMRRRLPAMKGSCLCGAIQYEVLGLGN